MKCNNNKKITFLMLHLGYGGIETATINTANELSKYYNVELVSFYNLNNNQEKLINKDVIVRHLYNGEPNREDFRIALKSKNIFKILKEGIKAISILRKKKSLMIKEIKECNSDVIVSTRMDYSVLLSKYGKNNAVKIAQEHLHHNNDKKYIDNLKTKYMNIDYLFALTKTLESDYKKFLVNNKHTKIVCVPNMLNNIPLNRTTLKNNNVISVGRLHPGKCIDELIDIYVDMKLEVSKLYIIGDGEMYDALSDKIDKLGVRDSVIMLGYKNKKEIENYMLDSSLFLMTSASEGLPMVLLEAMSYGVPCIAYETSSGVNDIIIDSYNGYVIKDRNEALYKEKINYLLNNKDELKKFSDNAIETSKKFSNSEIVRIWIDVLEKEKF